MPKNSGKKAETEFEDSWALLGKRAYLFRLADAAEIYARVGRKGNVRPQPSDYILVHGEETEFAEVKSTQDETAFRFSLLKAKQTAAASMVNTAGGKYFIYVKSLHLGSWFKVPFEWVQMVKKSGRSSIQWTELEAFKWNPLRLASM